MGGIEQRVVRGRGRGQAHLKPEQLDEANSWYCPRCKKHVRATKKLDIWSLPEILVVHLKRFSHSRLSRDKIDARVNFPLEGLDLQDYMLRRQVLPAAPKANSSWLSLIFFLTARKNRRLRIFLMQAPPTPAPR